MFTGDLSLDDLLLTGLIKVERSKTFRQHMNLIPGISREAMDDITAQGILYFPKN